MFDRLIGLETEYAIRFHPADSSASTPSKYRLYESLRDELQRRILTVPAKHFKEGVFLATGGAVWFEAERPSAGGGLIEGTTPECRGPYQAIVYQRALDRLLAASAGSAKVDGQFCLIKNDRDSSDNVYGAQENYEATLASGWQLRCWRAGLLLIFPLAMITWFGILLSVMATLAYFLLAGVVYLPVKLATGGRRSLALFLFGRDLADGRDTCIHVPVWLEASLQLVTRILTAPLAAALYALLLAVAFRRVRTLVLPFLVSRSIFAGAGTVDAASQFQVSDKAPAINCVVGFGGMLFDRPIFSMGHFFKVAYAESWFSPRRYFELFSSRQRLQLALGDSNMCERAELLRVGATALVLDAIESGSLRNCPRVHRPIRALHAFSADPTLQATVRLKDDAPATALELQRFYLNACRTFLNTCPEAPAEAWEVFHLWEHTLTELGEISGGADPEVLIGQLDWVTKKYLLDQSVDDPTWSQSKKIDIRYHELSPDGYYQMLEDSGLTISVVQPEEIDRALRSAPPDSPATTRGHYIREFAFGDEPVRANWKSVVIGRGWEARVIRLGRYGRASQPATKWWHIRRRKRTQRQ